MPGMVQIHFFGEFPPDSVYLMVVSCDPTSSLMTLKCSNEDCKTLFGWPVDRKAGLTFAPSVPPDRCPGCGKRAAGIYAGYNSESEYRSLLKR